MNQPSAGRSTAATGDQTAVWLALSLAAAALYSALALRGAFAGSYVVQEDARQHVFWMPRFRDPELFPHDLLADYFQAIAPLGYTALYWLFARLGIDPLLLSKLLPPVLSLAAAMYCFRTFLLILPVPSGAFIATLLLNQSLWFQDDLISATPRAFFVPLLLAFLYHLLRARWPACFAVLALEASFYPPAALISAGVLVLWPWQPERGPWARNQDRRIYLLCGGGIALAALLLLAQAGRSAEFGPIITAAEASRLPEFSPGGRTSFFAASPWVFWVTGSRSGLLPEPLMPPLLLAGLLLPLVAAGQSRLPLVSQLTPGLRPLVQVLLASLGAFVLAHLTLFRLYFPSRYTGTTLSVVLALAAGVVLTVVLEAVYRQATRESRGGA